LDVSYLHVFTYSERENTLAKDMDGAVPMNIRKERNKRLRILSEKKRRFFYKQHLNTVRPVLFESKISEEKLTGFTDNYIKVESAFVKTLDNTIQDVVLHQIDDKGICQIRHPECV